jgi:hypothetical protein
MHIILFFFLPWWEPYASWEIKKRKFPHKHIYKKGQLTNIMWLDTLCIHSQFHNKLFYRWVSAWHNNYLENELQIKSNQLLFYYFWNKKKIKTRNKSEKSDSLIIKLIIKIMKLKIIERNRIIVQKKREINRINIWVLHQKN